jgi:uncharacterized membrane protein YhaH (DUF805 family)
MDFVTAVKTALGKFATFEGRARRAEYWWFALFNLLVMVLTMTLDAVVFGGEMAPFNIVASLVLLVPNIAVGVRRLHDLDRSGWWYLILLVPLVGLVLLLVWSVMRGTQGANRFGADPVDDRVLAMV